MAEQNETPQGKGITGITVSGFKSLRDDSDIEIRNLTILAGANSSGKSSIMQPLLLMKQTLEAPYDPGSLLLNGPNVKFTSSQQFMVKLNKDTYLDFQTKIVLQGGLSFKVIFRRDNIRKRFYLVKVEYKSENRTLSVTPKISKTQLDMLNKQFKEHEAISSYKPKFSVTKNRFFLDLVVQLSNKSAQNEMSIVGIGLSQTVFKTEIVFPARIPFEDSIRQIIHVPGVRGNPERNYVSTPITGPAFQGSIEFYTASLINNWAQKKTKEIQSLSHYLKDLGLASHITTRQLDETNIRVMVSRHLQSIFQDSVNIADVGFGVSQILPVLVALLVAEPEQLVYIEQPELHLHPRAQVALAQVLADAANRGVRVVVETHSDLLILGIQTLVAERKLGTDKVKLHWFKRDDEGMTHITPSDMNEDGSYEGWPEDFADVQFSAGNAYLDAVEKRRAENLNGN